MRTRHLRLQALSFISFFVPVDVSCALWVPIVLRSRFRAMPSTTGQFSNSHSGCSGVVVRPGFNLNFISPCVQFEAADSLCVSKQNVLGSTAGIVQLALGALKADGSLAAINTTAGTGCASVSFRFRAYFAGDVVVPVRGIPSVTLYYARAPSS